MEEACEELLECARYGESDELAALLENRDVLIDYADEVKCALNGHLSENF
jgi:hypothetical protein